MGRTRNFSIRFSKASQTLTHGISARAHVPKGSLRTKKEDIAYANEREARLQTCSWCGKKAMYYYTGKRGPEQAACSEHRNNLIHRY